MEEHVSLSDLLAILKRRKWSLILPAILCFAIALVAVVVIPPTYRSSSTILIEDQEMPREFVAAAVTGYAEQRLQIINQRIMSATRVIEIINRFNLYDEYRKRMNTEDLIARMRKDTSLQTISADIRDSRSGQARSATIAFSLSFEGKRPELVQQVAAALASLYLEENLRVREQQMAGVSKFLEDEADALKEQLSEIDSRISDFKGRHVTALPELFQANLQVLDRIDRDIDILNAQIGNLKVRQSYLQSQLAVVPREGSDRDLLRQLRANLTQLESRFSERHPDVVKTKAEIAKIEARLKTMTDKKDPGPDESLPDNLAFISLSSDLAAVEMEMDSALRQIRDLRAKRDQYRRRIDASPKVDEVYKTLMAERNNIQLKYDDLMRKALEARIAQGLEKDQMGERFTLIEPARLPEKPVKPNVPAILLIGLILGIGAGVGTAALREFTDSSVRSSKDLAEKTGLPVLVSLPEIVTREDQQQERRLRIKILAAAAVMVVLGILILHFFFMDLDILWAKVMRRIFI